MRYKLMLRICMLFAFLLTSCSLPMTSKATRSNRSKKILEHPVVKQKAVDSLKLKEIQLKAIKDSIAQEKLKLQEEKILREKKRKRLMNIIANHSEKDLMDRGVLKFIVDSKEDVHDLLNDPLYEKKYEVLLQVAEFIQSIDTLQQQILEVEKSIIQYNSIHKEIKSNKSLKRIQIELSKKEREYLNSLTKKTKINIQNLKK